MRVHVRVHVAWRVASSTLCQLSWLRRLTIYTESGLSEVGQMWSPLDHRQTMLGQPTRWFLVALAAPHIKDAAEAPQATHLELQLQRPA